LPPPEALTPPHNLDAEESVLGAMMLSPHAVEACMDVLEGREFYRPSHGRIFKAAVAVYSKGQPVDPITVADELERDGGLKHVEGGIERIHELNALVPAASNAKHYATIVRETWLARGLVKAGMELTRLGYERSGSIEEVFAEADAKVIELQGYLERRRDSVFNGKQLAEDFLERLSNPEEALAGVQPPFTFLSPLKGGRLYVLGGYQADGKTALAMQFLRAACEGGARVGFHSIEMSRTDLTDRLIAQMGVPYEQVRDKEISDTYREKLNEALVSIAEWDWEIIDDEAVDPSVIRRSQRRGRYDLLIVDHLHRIPIKDPKYDRQELEKAVRQITNIAREFEIPVLLLAQLSRSGDKKDPFPRPTMADLRGSAMIEAEASAVWFVWRKRDKQHQPGSEAEFIIAKNRHGQLGWQHLWFHGRQVRFAMQETT